MTDVFLQERVSDYFAGRKLKKLPKEIVQDKEIEEIEAAESVDETQF